MERLYGAISGGSMLISGTLILNLVMAGMDWMRIGKYGLFNELGNRGIAPIMFIIGVLLMIVGLIFIFVAPFSEKEVELKDNDFEK